MVVALTPRKGNLFKNKKQPINNVHFLAFVLSIYLHFIYKLEIKLEKKKYLYEVIISV